MECLPDSVEEVGPFRPPLSPETEGGTRHGPAEGVNHAEIGGPSVNGLTRAAVALAPRGQHATDGSGADVASGFRLAADDGHAEPGLGAMQRGPVRLPALAQSEMPPWDVHDAEPAQVFARHEETALSGDTAERVRDDGAKPDAAPPAMPWWDLA